MKISRFEIEQERNKWIRYVLNDEETFREKPKYGNRDARFRPTGSPIGNFHVDQYNAISKPISHVAHWLHEKTGINEGLLRILGYGVTAYVGYRVGKYSLMKRY